MRIIGLTGSIGMGKSFIAAECIRSGIPVFDADKTVHNLLEIKEVQEDIARVFPNIVEHGSINRQKLGQEIFANKTKRLLLESILHPRVFKIQQDFLEIERKKGRNAVILEIPLLFETGADKRCDAVIVAVSSLFLQKRRVLSRQFMTEKKLSSILKIQLNNTIKRQKADFIIYTGLGKAHTRSMVRLLMKQGFHRKGKI